jgi:glycosyltransferase involved in cell wall biosynthesis
VLDRSQPVITFVNRNFEPLRGFHIFMRALPRLLAEVPEAQVVLVARMAAATAASRTTRAGARG